MPILVWLLIILAALILVASLVLSFYNTRRSNLKEVHTPAEYGLQYESIEFKTRDHLTLRGVWIPRPGSDKAIIFLHGHASSHDLDIYRAPALHAAGYNVLFFDFRAHGRSDGKMQTFGYKERWDVLAAIEFLHSKGMQHIGLLGTSYGGMTAILTAAICHEVEAVISDGGAARLTTGSGAWALERGFPAWVGRSLIWLFFAMTSIRIGANLLHYEPIRWVGQVSPCPIFFIHGDHDLYCADFDDLYAAAKEPKELWRLPEAGHTDASKLYPEEYAGRTIDFFGRYL